LGKAKADQQPTVKNTKKTRHLLTYCSLFTAAAVICGCASDKAEPKPNPEPAAQKTPKTKAGYKDHNAKTSKRMQDSVAPPDVPPGEKSLVCIHRRKAGFKLYTSIWDGTHLIGDLGDGHSLAYVCEPGKHYFLNRSTERAGVVEAELLPGKTYDLWLDIPWATFVVSFELKPVKPGSKQRDLVAKWSRENRWVTADPSATTPDPRKVSEIEQIIRDFTTGEKQARLQHLAPGDSR
jgi:hypothetical protein